MWRLFVLILMIFLCGVAVSKEPYQNWDFEDIPGWCARSKKTSSMEIPHFGGNPNPSQVWSLGENGSCGCAKYLH